MKDVTPDNKSAARAWAALLALVFTLGACDILPFGRDAEEFEEPEEPIFAVAAAEVDEERLVDSIRANGDVEPAATIDVYPDAFGEVTELKVSVGDTVEKDDVIAEIDQSRPGESFVPSPVETPISGRVVAVPVRVGSNLQQGRPVAQVATTGELQVSTHIPERYVDELSLGQTAEVELTGYEGETLDAEVVELSPMLDPATRTIETTLEFTDPDQHARAGMFARISIVTDEREDTPVVPADAVVTRQDRQYVFVIDDEERAEQREVELGLQTAEQIEVVSGVEPGEEIVVEGQGQLEDGVKLRLIEDDETPAEAS